MLLGWPKSSFGFFCKMLWKNRNEPFGQPNIKWPPSVHWDVCCLVPACVTSLGLMCLCCLSITLGHVRMILPIPGPRIAGESMALSTVPALSKIGGSLQSLPLPVLYLRIYSWLGGRAPLWSDLKTFSGFFPVSGLHLWLVYAGGPGGHANGRPGFTQDISTPSLQAVSPFCLVKGLG